MSSDQGDLPPHAEFAEALKLAMARRGLSIHALAVKMGKSDAAVHKWRSGNFTPRKHDLPWLVEALDLQVSDDLAITLCRAAGLHANHLPIMTFEPPDHLPHGPTVSVAWDRAVRRLVKKHDSEFARILAEELLASATKPNDPDVPVGPS